MWRPRLVSAECLPCETYAHVHTGTEVLSPMDNAQLSETFWYSWTGLLRLLFHVKQEIGCFSPVEAKRKQITRYVWRSRLQVTPQNCSCSAFWALGQLSSSSPLFPRFSGSAIVCRRDSLPPLSSVSYNASKQKAWRNPDWQISCMPTTPQATCSPNHLSSLSLLPLIPKSRAASRETRDTFAYQLRLERP